jgi:hypothetical protein
MKPILKVTLITALVIVAAGATALGVAYAQGGGPKEGLAELLGLEPEELRELLHSGKTIEELADEAGVDLEEFRAEMAAKHEEEMREKIEEALAAGDISQEQADWLLEGLDKGYIPGPFFKGGGRKGMGSGCDREGFPGSRDHNKSPDQQ